jgi:hypothetical protein
LALARLKAHYGFEEPDGGVVLLLPEVPEEELLLPELPGDSAPPVAEPAPDKPKYEKTLWRQLGWERSVVASKLGADCSLLVSPLKTKLVCPAVEVVAPALELGRNSIHGTATCFPPAVEEAPPVVVVLLEVLEVVPAEAPAPETEMTAKSSRPEAGLRIVSLIVPIC